MPNAPKTVRGGNKRTGLVAKNTKLWAPEAPEAAKERGTHFFLVKWKGLLCDRNDPLREWNQEIGCISKRVHSLFNPKC